MGTAARVSAEATWLWMCQLEPELIQIETAARLATGDNRDALYVHFKKRLSAVVGWKAGNRAHPDLCDSRCYEIAIDKICAALNY